MTDATATEPQPDPARAYLDYLGELTVEGRARGLRDVIRDVIRGALAEAWQDGFEAGHDTARAINAEWPEMPVNPYRSPDA